MPRAMTPAEKPRFQGYFPSLDVNHAVVTGEMSTVYNCIAWTVGVTNRWLWPGNTLAQFDTFYKGFGLHRSGNGEVAGWGQSTSNMTHGCISGPGHGPRWESKCGGDLRIQHALGELIGASYGRVVAFYTRSRSQRAPKELKLEEAVKEKDQKSYLTAPQKKTLRAERDAVDPDLRMAFEEAFGAWKQTWFLGGLAINSNPHSRSIGKEYDALIALGPEIMPLVVEKLADPENFLALQLYDAIQPNEWLVVHFEADDERILEGEQGRAKRAVKAWFANR
jgi:hypothetical protein